MASMAPDDSIDIDSTQKVEKSVCLSEHGESWNYTALSFSFCRWIRLQSTTLLEADWEARSLPKGLAAIPIPNMDKIVSRRYIRQVDD